MPGKTGEKWTWNQSRQSSNAIVAVMLIKPNHSIAITFPRPSGWTGERKQDEDFLRALLFSAAEECWTSGTATP
jgi:hypothetical protein